MRRKLTSVLGHGRTGRQTICARSKPYLRGRLSGHPLPFSAHPPYFR